MSASWISSRLDVRHSSTGPYLYRAWYRGAPYIIFFLSPYKYHIWICNWVFLQKFFSLYNEANYFLGGSHRVRLSLKDELKSKPHREKLAHVSLTKRNMAEPRNWLYKNQRQKASNKYLVSTSTTPDPLTKTFGHHHFKVQTRRYLAQNVLSKDESQRIVMRR